MPLQRAFRRKAREESRVWAFPKRLRQFTEMGMPCSGEDAGINDVAFQKRVIFLQAGNYEAFV